MELVVNTGRSLEVWQVDGVGKRLDDIKPFIYGKKKENNGEYPGINQKKLLEEKGYEICLDPKGSIKLYETKTGQKYDKKVGVPREYLVYVATAYEPIKIQDVLTPAQLTLKAKQFTRQAEQSAATVKLKQKYASQYGYDSWADWVTVSKGDLVPEEKIENDKPKEDVELTDLFEYGELNDEL